MTRTHITIDASSFSPLLRRVQAMGQFDASTLLPRLGEYLQRSTQERFKTQTDPDGAPWAQLAPHTKKRKKYNPQKILTLRGTLRSQIRYQVLDKHSVQVGSALPYAATHQFGRDAIPARPFVGLSAADRQEIQAIIADWAAEQGFK
ncbi:phage virion morphogenesis protein [Melaminivora sp.]